LFVSRPFAAEGNRNLRHEEPCLGDEPRHLEGRGRGNPGHGGAFERRDHDKHENGRIKSAQHSQGLLFTSYPAVVKPDHDVRGQLEAAFGDALQGFPNGLETPEMIDLGRRFFIAHDVQQGLTHPVLRQLFTGAMIRESHMG